jgi:hypothetical protein
MGLYIGLPLLAPVLMHSGHAGLANVIYTSSSPSAPDAGYAPSFSMAQATYNLQKPLADLLGGTVRRATSATPHGQEGGVCQRDVALYGTMFMAGLLFSLVRRRLRRSPHLPGCSQRRWRWRHRAAFGLWTTRRPPRDHRGAVRPHVGGG